VLAAGLLAAGLLGQRPRTVSEVGAPGSEN